MDRTLTVGDEVIIDEAGQRAPIRITPPRTEFREYWQMVQDRGYTYLGNGEFASEGCPCPSCRELRDLTPEQRVARAVRREARIVDRWQELQARIKQCRRVQERRQRIDAKAVKLLRSLLTADQRADYDATESFVVMGSLGGRYRITKGDNHNVYLLGDGDAKAVSSCDCCAPEYPDAVAELCALPGGGLPLADVAVGQMLAITTDEREFFETANHSVRVGDERWRTATAHLIDWKAKDEARAARVAARSDWAPITDDGQTVWMNTDDGQTVWMNTSGALTLNLPLTWLDTLVPSSAQDEPNADHAEEENQDGERVADPDEQANPALVDAGSSYSWTTSPAATAWINAP